MHWLIDNCYQVKIIFISGYVEKDFFNFMKNLLPDAAYCVVFAHKLKVVILVLGYGHFLQENGSHDSSADSSKKCRLTYVYSHLNRIFYSIA